MHLAKYDAHAYVYEHESLISICPAVVLQGGRS
jgi:hypothetical protein